MAHTIGSVRRSVGERELRSDRDGVLRLRVTTLLAWLEKRHLGVEHSPPDLADHRLTDTVWLGGQNSTHFVAVVRTAPRKSNQLCRTLMCHA